MPIVFRRRFNGERTQACIDWIKAKHPECNSEVINFIGENLTVIKNELQEHRQKRVNFLNYQIAMGKISKEIGEIALKMEKLSPVQLVLKECFRQWAISKTTFETVLAWKNLKN